MGDQVMNKSGRILITMTQGAEPGDISDAIGEFLKKYDQETGAPESEIVETEADEKKVGVIFKRIMSKKSLI